MEVGGADRFNLNLLPLRDAGWMPRGGDTPGRQLAQSSSRSPLISL
jgi:hypothetical protein